MSKRRCNGEGSITLRKDGKWLAFLKIGMGADGKPKYKYLYGDTQKEAIQKLDELKLTLNMGIQVERGDITVEKWCMTWMEKYKKKLRPTTKTSYYNNIRIHINLYIGGVALNKLETGQIQLYVG